MTSAFKLGKYSETAHGSFVVPDEGFYIMRLDDWGDPAPSAYIDRETGEYPLRVNLKFKIQSDISGDTEFEGAECGKWVDVDLNPNVKGSIWHVLLALDPMTEPEPEGSIEEYRGKDMIGEVVHVEKPDKKNPGKVLTFANIGAFKPMKKAKAAVKVAKNPMLEPDEE